MLFIEDPLYETTRESVGRPGFSWLEKDASARSMSDLVKF